MKKVLLGLSIFLFLGTMVYADAETVKEAIQQNDDTDGNSAKEKIMEELEEATSSGAIK